MAYTADSTDGRLLLALRAGPMTKGELYERLGGESRVGPFVRAGLVTYDGEYYRLTESGRAACPFRNPLAAGLKPPAIAKLPQEELMVSRIEITDRIKAAGSAGITRAALVTAFDDQESAVDQHILALHKAGLVFKPGRGHVVWHECYQPAQPGKAGETLAEAKERLAKALQCPTPEPTPSGAAHAPAEQPAVSDNNTGSRATDAPPLSGGAAEARARGADGLTRQRPAAPSRHEDGRDISFAIWDDGVLTIQMEGHVIDLPAPATARLARFIGQMEAA